MSELTSAGLATLAGRRPTRKKRHRDRIRGPHECTMSLTCKCIINDNLGTYQFIRLIYSCHIKKFFWQIQNIKPDLHLFSTVAYAAAIVWFHAKTIDTCAVFRQQRIDLEGTFWQRISSFLQRNRMFLTNFM